MTLSQLRGVSQLGGAAWGSGAAQHLSRVASLEDWSGSSEVPRFWGALGGPWQRGAEHGAGTALCAPGVRGEGRSAGTEGSPAL